MTKPLQRPLRILASYCMDDARVSERYANTLHSLAQRAGQALAYAGPDIQVLFVNASRPGGLASELLDRVDGVVILGGADVDPTFYTQDPAVQKQADTHAVNPEADVFEIELARNAVGRDVPLLGICRGMQVINVALGGTLVSDIGPGTMHNVRPSADEMTEHEVQILEGTRLSHIYGVTRVSVRSAHHQAVARLPETLTPAAWASDGLIEGYESSGSGWLVGIQWHPEDSGANDNHLRALARALVSAVRSHRQLEDTVNSTLRPAV
ncbi:gamma-glutamyl-gamma-aminobutyrate hydrolase family protein [Citricoccus alkalitolerans]|uniref:Gamma-glutamyl-gamma-aminobutyrate hydrolase family protein n=1 Tax=Citricoccus alkalitolerans TaxID=246603 RepID=A0ABV8XWV2_9MICC